MEYPGVFDWAARLEEVTTDENIGMGAATGKVKGFCVVCGDYLQLPLKETVGHCIKCNCLRRCYNPFRRR